MPTDYKDWAAKHSEAAKDLEGLLCSAPWPKDSQHDKKTEAWAQQQIRMKVAKAGAMAWRNNVGATPVKCPDCGAKRQPIRYGLANDSHKLNSLIKSSDLILAIPRTIKQEDVGKTMAQFGTIDAKRPGWKFTGKGEEAGQAAWMALILKLGGFAAFSTGEIEL